MAKQKPFTSQQERLERLIKNLQDEVAALKGMIDTERSIVAAQYMKVEGASSSQIIRVSEDGGLEAGESGVLPWRAALTEEVSHTGDTLETELRKIVIPGGKMGPNGFVKIKVICKPHTNAKFNVYWGQKISANRIGYWIHTSTDFYVSSRDLYVWNKNATNAQSGENWNTALQFFYNFIAWAAAPAWTEDTASDVPIYFTVKNNAAGDTSYLYFALVEAFYRD